MLERMYVLQLERLVTVYVTLLWGHWSVLRNNVKNLLLQFGYSNRRELAHGVLPPDRDTRGHRTRLALDIFINSNWASRSVLLPPGTTPKA